MNLTSSWQKNLGAHGSASPPFRDHPQVVRLLTRHEKKGVACSRGFGAAQRKTSRSDVRSSLRRRRCFHTPVLERVPNAISEKRATTFLFALKKKAGSRTTSCTWSRTYQRKSSLQPSACLYLATLLRVEILSHVPWNWPTSNEGATSWVSPTASFGLLRCTGRCLLSGLAVPP